MSLVGGLRGIFGVMGGVGCKMRWAELAASGRGVLGGRED